MSTSIPEFGYFCYVHILLCEAAANVRWTKTKKLMIRCKSCKSIQFANGYVSQQLVKNLPAFNNKANEFYGTYYY